MLQIASSPLTSKSEFTFLRHSPKHNFSHPWSSRKHDRRKRKTDSPLEIYIYIYSCECIYKVSMSMWAWVCALTRAKASGGCQGSFSITLHLIPWRQGFSLNLSYPVEAILLSLSTMTLRLKWANPAFYIFDLRVFMLLKVHDSKI